MSQIGALKGMLEISDLLSRGPDVPAGIKEFIEAADVNQLTETVVETQRNVLSWLSVRSEEDEGGMIE